MSIAVCGLHFKDALTQFEDGDIKGASAKVEDGYFFILFLVQPISEGRRRRFVDDSQNVQTGDFPCILRGLTL
ncbi:MAG: NAD-specific glutamate dehydrogenase [Syntrophus sp. PtaB.Bin001]|nr:MAG: NAD-specific glutamate dehydrogenase [Syntrophus sp. PtaB.Bin001]